MDGITLRSAFSTFLPEAGIAELASSFEVEQRARRRDLPALVTALLHGVVARLRARPDRATERLSRSFSFGQRAIPASRTRSCD